MKCGRCNTIIGWQKPYEMCVGDVEYNNRMAESIWSVWEMLNTVIGCQKPYAMCVYSVIFSMYGFCIIYWIMPFWSACCLLLMIWNIYIDIFIYAYIYISIYIHLYIYIYGYCNMEYYVHIHYTSIYKHIHY